MATGARWRVLVLLVLGPMLLAGPAARAITIEGTGQSTPAPSAAAAHSARPEPVRYRQPVDGWVVRGFTATGPFSAGHRGVDLAAPRGAAVVSAADGRVTFAGSVAGTRWVTVAHADGIRTSYGHLAITAVARGDRVRAGQVLGRAAGERVGGVEHVHWGARRGTSYVDPLTLLGAPTVTVRLVGPASAGAIAQR